MTFSEIYRNVDDMYSEWGMKGVALVGETDGAWIFKSHVVKGDVLSGESVIVDKSTGLMRPFNIAYKEDRDIGYNAKVIDKEELKKLLAHK